MATTSEQMTRDEVLALHGHVLQRLGEANLVLQAAAQRKVDEMAVLFRTAGMGIAFVEWLNDAGWQQQGADDDTVYTTPILSEYQVSYGWYVHPDHDWRYELMLVPSGFSPLHMALMHRYDRQAYVVHASFKCQDETFYGIAKSRLVFAGMREAMACASGYGSFAYYTRPDLGVYLKPRVNLRDDQHLGLDVQ